VLPDSALPADGYLWFFFSHEQPWGFDPKDAGGSRVLYRAGAPELRLATLDGREAPESYPARALNMEQYDDLPAIEPGHPLADALNDAECERYDAVRDYLGGAGRPHHKLLGHAEPIQNAMELECQLVTHGLYCGDPSGHADPRAKDLEPGAAEWRLLLQLDTDDDAAMMWGDVGRLYFWIREEDLRERRFERTWTILQCH
jgi:uncharacterized protein YwqG